MNGQVGRLHRESGPGIKADVNPSDVDRRARPARGF
jgi:hypothetical protein